MVVYPDGDVKFRFDPKRPGPTSRADSARTVGTLRLIAFQVEEWVTRMMRAAATAHAVQGAMLQKILEDFEPGAGSEGVN